MFMDILPSFIFILRKSVEIFMCNVLISLTSNSGKCASFGIFMCDVGFQERVTALSWKTVLLMFRGV